MNTLRPVVGTTMPRRLLRMSCVASLALSMSCLVNVAPDDDSSTNTSRHGLKLNLFPFEDLTNWWMYTAEDDNPLSILVIDTISDNGITYYKVSFRENRVDTTDDWFRRTSSGIDYNTNLIGTYSTFLPDSFPDSSGSFASDSQNVRYSHGSSVTIAGKSFSDAVSIDYPQTFLHGFNEIVLADSIGIVALIDSSGRFPVTYTLDSCQVNGVMRRF